MVQIPKESLNLLGINLQGDIGPWTCYRNIRRGTVAFIKAPPKEPATELQAMLRLRWSRIARLWHGLTEAERYQWELTVRRNRLRITAYNLFMWHHCRQDFATLKTLTLHAGTTLLVI